MVISYIISIILFAVIVYLLKHIIEIDGEEFAFRVWHLICLIIIFLLPFYNAMTLAVLLIMMLAGTPIIKYKFNSNKLFEFLNRKI